METVFYTVSKERWHDVAALQRRLKLVDNQIEALMKDPDKSDVGGEVSFKDREKELYDISSQIIKDGAKTINLM